jgi:hypothetical protein
MEFLLEAYYLREALSEAESSAPDMWFIKSEGEDIDMVTKQQALQNAREECIRRGWPWNNQSKVKWGLFSYTVWGGGRKGGNLCFKIRKKDGSILSAAMTPK